MGMGYKAYVWFVFNDTKAVKRVVCMLHRIKSKSQIMLFRQLFHDMHVCLNAKEIVKHLKSPIQP